MRKIVRIFLNPITWTLVLLGVMATKKLIAIAASGNADAEPTVGDEMPDDDLSF